MIQLFGSLGGQEGSSSYWGTPLAVPRADALYRRPPKLMAAMATNIRVAGTMNVFRLISPLFPLLVAATRRRSARFGWLFPLCWILAVQRCAGAGRSHEQGFAAGQRQIPPVCPARAVF